MPEVYRKKEERCLIRDTLSKQIELLSTKRKGLNTYRKKFIEQKKERIRVFERIINNLRKDIRTKERFFKCLKPEADTFLSILKETFFIRIYY